MKVMGMNRMAMYTQACQYVRVQAGRKIIAPIRIMADIALIAILRGKPGGMID
jgi:hypothetical protein